MTLMTQGYEQMLPPAAEREKVLWRNNGKKLLTDGEYETKT